MNIAIIGCGLIGARRATFLGHHKLLVAADSDLSRARKVADSTGSEVLPVSDWRQAANDHRVEVVIVATTPDVMPTIVAECLRAGKHVFVEKPAARSHQELLSVVAEAKRTGLTVRIGFNHRYHPAIRKAHGLVVDGAVGELMYIRARYGHGGRLGYEKGWRAQPDISGGGELLDQGTHLIDLARWFLGEFSEVCGHVGTYFWDMPVEDNAFILLRSADAKVAWLHVSWSEWKNLFCFEIFGKSGKLQIDGLGGSYGTEVLTFYKMKAALGPPDIERWEFAEKDMSWQVEFDEFMADIEAGTQSGPTVEDALAVLKIVETLYESRNSIAWVGQ